MSNASNSNRSGAAVKALIVVMGVFLLARYAGGLIFTNDWSFVHWQHLPWYYGPLWIVVTALITLTLYRRRDLLATLAESPLKTTLSLFGLLALFWLLRFDSVLYGGGNLRVAQLAKLETNGGIVVYQWFEFGITVIAHKLYLIFLSFDFTPNVAAGLAWRVLSFVATAGSLWASAKIACTLSDTTENRPLVFLLAFFGAQSLLYFGFIGIGPVIVAATLWFAHFALSVVQKRQTMRLLWLWIVAALGVFLHASLVYLLPAALAVTIMSVIRTKRQAIIGFAAGLVAYLVCLILFYTSVLDLYLARDLLFTGAKQPGLDYSLFSLRHIGDFLQLFFLAIPTVAALKWLLLSRPQSFFTEPSLVVTYILTLSGGTIVFLLDPVNSIALDAPAMLAYLTPVGLAVAILLGGTSSAIDKTSRVRVLPAFAAIAFMLPLCYLPSYIRIDKADSYVGDYLDQHPSFYATACFTLRDAYYYAGDYPEADSWELSARVKSQEFLALEGCIFMVGNGEYSDAISVLYPMVVNDPWWVDSRSLLVKAQLGSRNYRGAKPHVDTCLMLAPYSRKSLIHRYEWLRDTRDFTGALEAAREAVHYFPADTFIITDYMIIGYRAGQYTLADSLANTLLATDSTRAYPYWVKGASADRNGKPRQAIYYYRKFIEMAPTSEDAARVHRRMENLETALDPESGPKSP